MVRIGIVGAGGIAQAHLKVLKDIADARIVAICDIVREQTEKVAGEYGAAAYTDFDDMLNAEKLDALFLCVPPFAHGDMEEKAAARGIHLLVEKPLGLDMAIVKKKAEVIRNSGIIVSSGYILRHLDTVAVAKQYLQGKDIAMVRAHRINQSFLKSPWWMDINRSGGQLVEQTTHNIDMIRDLAGDVSKVYANMEQHMKDVPGLSIPDVTSVSLVFASGAIGHMVTTCVDQPSGSAGIEIMGRGFTLTYHWADLTITDAEGSRSFKNETNLMLKQDEAFIRAIQTGNRSEILSTYDEAMRTLAVTLAANQSAQSGLPVEL